MSGGGAGLDCSKILPASVGRLLPSAILPSASWRSPILAGSCFSLSSTGADFYLELERQSGSGCFTALVAERCCCTVGFPKF
jgi:hypothetical protein